MAKTADSQNTTSDPVFPAIEAHLAAIAAAERQAALDYARLTGGDCSVLSDAALSNALVNGCMAAKALVATAPTTPAGLKALEDHLRQYFSYGSGAALCIMRPLPGGGGMHGGGEGAWEWLIAKRAAELGIVAG